MKKLGWIFIFCLIQINLLGDVDKQSIYAQTRKLDDISRLVTEKIRIYSDPDLRDTERDRFVDWFRPIITDDTVIGGINTAIGFLTGYVSPISTKDIGEVNKENLDGKREVLDGIIALLDEIYARCVNTRNILAPTGYFMIELQRLFLGQLGDQEVAECFEGIIPLEMVVSRKINELLRYWQDKLSEIARQGDVERERVRDMQEQVARRIAEEEQRRREMDRIEQERAREEDARREQENREREALDAMRKRQEELAKAADEAQRQQAEELRRQRDAFESVKAELRRIIDEMKANKAIAEAHNNQAERKPKKTAKQARIDFAAKVRELRPIFGRNLNDATAPLFLEAFEIISQAMDELWDSKSEKTEITNPFKDAIPGILDVENSIYNASGKDDKGRLKPELKGFRLINSANEDLLLAKYKEIIEKREAAVKVKDAAQQVQLTAEQRGKMESIFSGLKSWGGFSHPTGDWVTTFESLNEDQEAQIFIQFLETKPQIDIESIKQKIQKGSVLKKESEFKRVASKIKGIFDKGEPGHGPVRPALPPAPKPAPKHEPAPGPELPKRKPEQKPIPKHKPDVEKKDEDAPPPLPAREDLATKALKDSLSSLKTSLQELKAKTELLQGKLVLLKDKLS